MSNISNNIAAEIVIEDYKGSTTSLSSYNLPITPLQFTPIISTNIGSGNRLIWYFGDGETSTEFNPTYYYKSPGSYTVNLIVINRNNKSQLAAIPVTVQIKDYLEDTFRINLNSSDSLPTICGKLSDPIVITQTLPVRSVIPPSSTASTTVLSTQTIQPLGFTPKSYRPSTQITSEISVTTPIVTPTASEVIRASTISYKVSGSNSTNFFFLTSNTYQHLLPYNSLIKKVYIPSLSGYEHTPISKINVPLSAVYGKIVNNTIVTSLTSDNTTTLIGYSGVDVYYYRDDLPTSKYTITFLKRNDFNNPLGITLKGSVAENILPNEISITSSGIDGDGGVSTSFDIDPNKFNNGKIHFVCKIKDAENNNIKDIPKLDLNTLNISVSTLDNSTLTYTLCSLQDTMSSTNLGGFFRGYIQIPNTTQQPITGVYISAQINYLSTSDGGSIVGDSELFTEGDDVVLTESSDPIVLETINALSGISSTFNIYPTNYYKLYKKGEEFDGEATYKSLRFQETLLDKEIFFGDFLGAIMGSENSDTEALAKKVYERIHNFVDNTNNVDTAEIVRLLSMGSMYGYDSSVFDNNLLSFPNKIQRIVSLLSINKHKLFGYKNQYNENLTPIHGTNREVYGKNLGDKIDTTTYIVSANTDIVAFEKFSRKYTLLNTYQPLCASTPPSSQYYMLSDYNSTWGWPLNLPVDPIDINIYYDFYNFVDLTADNITGGMLNFDLTTVDFDTNYNDLVGAKGIYENIILDTLYQSLSLTK